MIVVPEVHAVADVEDEADMEEDNVVETEVMAVHVVDTEDLEVVMVVDHEEVEVDDLALRWAVDMDKDDVEVHEEVREAHAVVQEVTTDHNEEVMEAVADINLSVATWTMYRMSRTNHPGNKVVVYVMAHYPHSLYTHIAVTTTI